MTTHSMVQECVDSYRVEETKEGIRISISVPKRFADLWLLKLSQLRASEEEIAENQPAERPLRLG